MVFTYLSDTTKRTGWPVIFRDVSENAFIRNSRTQFRVLRTFCGPDVYSTISREFHSDSIGTSEPIFPYGQTDNNAFAVVEFRDNIFYGARKCSTTSDVGIFRTSLGAFSTESVTSYHSNYNGHRVFPGHRY